ncbi:GNAT family N-acetyltransferase [Tissierella carlieri]|uniref:GNAT family N-acetyltransferase n=1 Tax=Tissierella carlieri TaxID=689904 RepID=UPI001C0F844F|nr:GNAT family N-acetyltransferase [Tissierella carlieri]
MSKTTLNIPHPYEDGLAESWISTHRDNLNSGKNITYAIVKKDTDELIGSISLMLNKTHKKAELGYWIGAPYWSQGYCTEASQSIIEFGFRELYLNRIYALAMVENAGSWRVMKKVKMKYEGIRRQNVIKDGVSIDLKSYGILREDFYRQHNR